MEKTALAIAAVPRGYLPVWAAGLRIDTITDFDIHLPLPEGRPPVLYRRKQLPFTEDVRSRLVENGVHLLCVPSDQKREYQRYIEGNLDAVLSDPTLSVDTKSKVMYLSATGLVEELMTGERVGEAIPRSRSLVACTSKFLLQEKGALESLMRVTSSDYYTYTHSVNVFVFSISLARRAGLSDPIRMCRFGEGALLHDVGKSLIDPSIINASGGLDERQWSEMKRHPVYGCDILGEQGVLDEIALDIVRHHHEKLTGAGYPDGIGGEEVSTFARICTIADIFDALTTRRSYKEAVKTFSALDLMRDKMSKDLDPDLFRIFVEMMGSPSGN